ncbi:Hvo_1808 family surface protein [Haloplanus aerogenes]|uniref:PGF-CTERM protein n=1 Tax=Haloplanus aerogenes TaxID=660522 RepID=A0A3M0CW98_9EURY|nr:Hvo_1808 family surface protein [Haloplanus aerogenes]AZH27029.1 PGF-CTERM sorting domain-containing protein [Haloplanus aerogenes]RMB13478.1 PGF-CTERM protein [Haloplanus aerogenes]
MSIPRTILLTLLAASLLVAPAVGATASGMSGATDTTTTSPRPAAISTGDTATDMVDSRPDPDEDVQGWENGYWHNETLANVTPDDGYTDAEIDKVRARSMARIEVVRDVEFEETPPVRVISREEYVNNVRERRQGVNISTAARLHQNAKFEALLMTGEETDYFEAQQQLQSSTIGGFYVLGNASGTDSIEQGEIVLISENAENPQLSEITLAQELFHSYQDKNLRIGQYNRSTEEDSRRIDAIIEGDGNYVDYLYEQRCGSEWTCFQPSSQSEGDGQNAPRPNLGLLVYSFVQYSEGPAWVHDLQRQGGWEAVDRAYANPPRSTEQFIHPEKYLQDPPTDVTVADRSNDEWYVPQLEGGVNYAVFGEAGMYSMLWFASSAVPRQDILTQRQLDPYDYDHPASAGWDGDKFYPYVTDESAETGEMGYVWKSVWDTPEDAQEFASAYRATLAGAGEPVPGHANTWRLPDDHPFNDAFYVSVQGSTVVIVNAPTVGELSEVRSGAAPQVETPTTTDAGNVAGTATESTETATATPTGTEGSAPGFGVGLVVVALVVAGLLFSRR